MRELRALANDVANEAEPVDERVVEFPGIKWFSKRNLELIRQWHLFWSEERAVSQLHGG